MATNVRKQHPQAPGTGVVQRVDVAPASLDVLPIVATDPLVAAQASGV